MDPSRYMQLVNNCDENAPLLSATPLGRYLDHVPLHQVPPSDLTQVHQALNVEQLIGRRDGLARDYRGLAELMGFNSVDLEARFKRSYNPTKCLIDAFKVGERTQSASVTDLLKLLEKLERFDIIDDFLPTLIRITNESKNCQQVANHDSRQVRDERVPDPSRIAANARPHGSSQYRYDAFLCYAPEDSDYAQDVLRALENNDKRIVTVDNLLAGQFEYDALVQMIALECRKVIIILTPNFLESKDCDFQAKFANEIAIKDGWFPKIIPILYEPFDDAKLSPMIRVISKIDMTRATQRDWQLRKLLASLEYDAHSLAPSGRQSTPASRLPTLTVSNGSQLSTPPITENSFSQASIASTDYDRLGSPEPIVDLAQSQSSSANISCSMSGVSDSGLNTRSFRSESSQLLPSGPESVGTPHFWKNWYRSFKSKVRGPSTATPSTISRDVLLPSSSDIFNQTESSDCRR